MFSQFKQPLLQIKHYQNHPQMIPYIGNEYGKKYKKLLIVAESHFLNEKYKNKDDKKNKFKRNVEEFKILISNWYDKKSSDLEVFDREYTSTTAIISNSKLINDKNTPCHKIFSNIDDAINKSYRTKLKETEKLFQYISFINFFQRPASKRGDSINQTSKDIYIANCTLYEVVVIIKPDFIFIVSSKAFEYLDKDRFKNYKIGHGSHPNSPWWNKKCKKYTNVNKRYKLSGKESFVDFVAYHEIFK